MRAPGWTALIRRTALTALAIVSLGCAVRRIALDYPSPVGPRYAGSVTAPRDRTPRDRLRVVSVNIKHANDIERAARELSTIDALRDPDLLLLQEMDLVGTEILACRLGLDYVYYPATVHPQSGRHFGVALLTPWTITRDEKIPLPSLSTRDDAAKAALLATVDVGGRAVHVANVHLQSGLTREGYHEQLSYLLDRIRAAGGADGPLVVAGDFNSYSRGLLETTERLARQHGLESAIQERTFSFAGVRLPLQLDHILASSALDATASRTVRLRSTDHRGLSADFRFANPAGAPAPTYPVHPFPPVICPVPARSGR